MNLHTLLQERVAKGNPVRIGLIGAGKFGAMVLAQARLTEGFRIVGVADLAVDRGRNALKRSGWPDGSVRLARSSSEINDAASSGRVGFTDDASQLVQAELEVIIECTGNAEAGVQHAIWAIEAQRHVVMVTVEADALVGPLLREQADRAGVVYSMAYGDQPALISEMVDWARTCGFEVVAAGKGTKYLPEYQYSDPDTVFNHYGFSAEQLAEGDFNAKMFNSFLDGTKSAIEMAAVSNATGLIPQSEGLGFPAVGVDLLPEVLKPRESGGVLAHSGTLEVISSLNRDGSPVSNDLRWGVFITFKAATDYVKQCFRQYGIVTDRSHTYAALYRPSHLIGLELGMSIASAVLRHEPTGAARQFLADVGAVAKKELAVGEALDGEGGYTVYGKLIPAQESLARRVLPIGLTSGARMVRPIRKDQWITYDDVQI
ncbi:MAG: SAF domain-containing protein, partial [Acidobacteria bacterium]|nr:SAF domain-containing protein [Acidobacteriota bacterium]